MLAPMNAALKLPQTLDEFLAWEERQPDRYEFLGRGRLRLVAGGSDRHNAITLNLASAFAARLRGGSCRVRAADLKVAIPSGCVLYPDVFVVCSPRRPDQTVVDDPVVVVEVLSPRTGDYDGTEKRWHYQSIPSLRHLVLIAQGEPKVEVATREADESWRSVFVTGLQGAVLLPALGLEIPLAEIYADVELDRAVGETA
jgi:Uma2 family endonuclease